jgi:hypothetical protein
MTTTARRFVIEDCDNHDRSRVVVCTINVHTSSVSSNRWCATVGNRNESHHSRPRLEDLRDQVTDEVARRALRQICVCQAPMTLNDLAYALTTEPVDTSTAPAGPLEEPDDLIGAVQALTDLTLIGSEVTDHDTTLTMLPWIADRLEHTSDPDLTIEHQRALSMHYHRLQQHRGDYGDLLDTPRHLAHLGRYEELTAVVIQAARMLPGTLAIEAYLAEIRPLIPVTERAWLLVTELAQRNLLSVGRLSAATRLANDMHAVIKGNTADPTNTEWQRDLSVSHDKLGDLAVAAGDLGAAGTAYTAALTIAQKLADADPTNTQWQRDLAVALERLENLG